MSFLDLIGKDDDDFTVIIDGIEVPVFSGSLWRSMEQPGASITAELNVSETDPELKNLLKPYQYLPCEAFLGETKKFTGLVYGTGIKISGKEVIGKIEGWTNTVDAVDSNSVPPYQDIEVDLKKRSETLLTNNFGDIKVSYEFPDTEKFERTAINADETVHEHLLTLAKQRGVLITTNDDGEWVYKNVETGPPIASIEEGRPPLLELDIFWDGRDRFKQYRALGKTPKRNKARRKGIATDDNISRFRLKTINANESTDGNIERAAKWERTRNVAESIKIQIDVDGWYTPRRTRLWEENTIVSLISPSAFIEDGFDFLIKTVEYSFQANGNSTKLELVPPSVYTGETIIEPWFQ
jgi:prophage tail gpP-like protein